LREIVDLIIGLMKRWDKMSRSSTTCDKYNWNNVHITSHHMVDGRRLQGLCIRKIHCNRFTDTLILIYNTPVSSANEISFVIKNHFLIWPEFV